MSQMSFSDAEYTGKRKKTRREVFLEEMELVVPWKALLGLIEPHYPVAGRGRRPYALESMLRVHLMQNWFALSDPAMEEALYEIASLRAFARLSLSEPITTTAANESDVEQIADLLHGKEQHVWADSGYRGAQTRVDREDLQWHIAARPSDIAKLPEGRRKAAQKHEHRKASVRAKVEHPFRVIKRQFGLMKVRFRGLAKNTAHVVTLFALSNLWMARRQLMAMAAVRPRSA